jgi:hypothetical protein
MSFKNDSRGVDPNGSSILLLPPGWYIFKIMEAEETISKNNDNQIIVRCSPIGNPEYANALLWHYVTFFKKEHKAAGMHVHFRKCIGVPYGGIDDVDSDDWIGKKFAGYVVKDSYKKPDTGEIIPKNKIAQVISVDEYQTSVKSSSNGEENSWGEDVPF